MKSRSSSNGLPIKAVFLDMDGTLLMNESEISPLTVTVLKKLEAMGVAIIIATGRPGPSVFATMKKYGLRPTFVVTSNGALIADKEGKILKKHTIDPVVARHLLSIKKQPNANGTISDDSPPKAFTTNVYSGFNWFTDKVIPEVQAALGPAMKPILADFDHPDSFIDDVESVWYIGTVTDMPLVQSFVRAHHDCHQVMPVLSLPYLCDVSVAGINKGTAVLEVCELLKVRVEEVAAFGDGMNDLEMLKVVGFPNIMGNAQSALKSGVPGGVVIHSNADDGVAKRLMELYDLSV